RISHATGDALDMVWDLLRNTHASAPQCVAKMGKVAIYSPQDRTHSTTSLAPLTFAEVAAFSFVSLARPGLTIGV
ncbi:hypothetical protein, partial [Thioclava dalianensis]|uniref:hypothetical protein n=1 Tax=Thioclava dalianensis TaxID=1185766 RepID=UPI001C4328C8